VGKEPTGSRNGRSAVVGEEPAGLEFKEQQEFKEAKEQLI